MAVVTRHDVRKDAAMMDFLIHRGAEPVQCGLLYGAYISITFRPNASTTPRRTHFDPLTTHAWDTHRAYF